MSIPFNRDNYLNGSQSGARKEALKKSGVRLLPFPFGKLACIASDCDFTGVRSGLDVLDTICYDWNFDFGDSAFLYNIRSYSHYGATQFFPLEDRAHTTESIFRSRDEFRKMARLGFIDHIHGPTEKRPSVFEINLKKAESEYSLQDNCHSWAVDDFASHEKQARDDYTENCKILPGSDLRHIELWFSSKCSWWKKLFGQLSSPQSPVLTISCRNGKVSEITDWQSKRKGDCLIFSALCERPGPLLPYLTLTDVSGIKVTWEGGNEEAPLVRFATSSGEEIAKSYEVVKETCGFPFRLWTDHCASGFLNSSAVKNAPENHASNKKNAARYIAKQPDSVSPSHGMLLDEKDSTAYCLRSLRNAGLKFVNPSGISGQPCDGFPLLEVISPSAGRDGTPILVARRMLPSANEEDIPVTEQDNMMKRKSRLLTFGPRLKSILQHAKDANEGWVYPFYTHIGADHYCDGVAQAIGGSLAFDWQNQQFNFTGDVKNDSRVLWWRASLFYDYCELLTRGLDPSSIRHTGDKVHLGRPKIGGDDIVPSQLHGLTLTVADAAKTSVKYSGGEINDMVRWGALKGIDEQFITVIEGMIRQRFVLRKGGIRSGKFSNRIGNVYYIGVSGLDWESEVVRITSETMQAEIFLGRSAAINDSASAVVGRAEYESVPDEEMCWIPVYGLSWDFTSSGRGKPATIFGKSVKVDILDLSGNSKDASNDIQICFGKPFSNGPIEVDEEELGSLDAWWKMVTNNGFSFSDYPDASSNKERAVG